MSTNPKNLTEMLIPPSATVHRHHEPAIPTPPTPHNLRQAGWRVVIHHLRRGETRHTLYATARSIARCSRRDAYCKKTGVGVALRRALASLQTDVRVR